MSYLKTAHFVSPHKTAHCVLPSWARPKRLGQQVFQCSSTAYCQAEHPLGGRTGRLLCILMSTIEALIIHGKVSCNPLRRLTGTVTNSRFDIDLCHHHRLLSWLVLL